MKALWLILPAGLLCASLLSWTAHKGGETTPGLSIVKDPVSGEEFKPFRSNLPYLRRRGGNNFLRDFSNVVVRAFRLQA